LQPLIADNQMSDSNQTPLTPTESQLMYQLSSMNIKVSPLQDEYNCFTKTGNEAMERLGELKNNLPTLLSLYQKLSMKEIPDPFLNSGLVFPKAEVLERLLDLNEACRNLLDVIYHAQLNHKPMQSKVGTVAVTNTHPHVPNVPPTHFLINVGSLKILRQEEAAEQLGISASYLSKLHKEYIKTVSEKTSTPTIKHNMKIEKGTRVWSLAQKAIAMLEGKLAIFKASFDAKQVKEIETEIQAIKDEPIMISLPRETVNKSKFFKEFGMGILVLSVS